MGYKLFRGKTEVGGKAVYTETGSASSEEEAGALCKAAIDKFLEGKNGYVYYPLGPRGNREFGQPQLPFPRGNTYMVALGGNEAASAMLFGWRKTS